MADNNENSTRNLFAKEPLSTDSSGNLTPEAIAALLAQNSESSESESELANIDDVIIENYAISENIEEETTEVESVTELEAEAETETTSEPLSTDASGNLTPEAIAALMAQNNEPESEPKPVESESAEEAIEEEPVESEIPNIESTDDVKVETETKEPESEVELETETTSEPLATDASGNLTSEAIAALMAQNNELETEPIESETSEEAVEEETVEPESEPKPVESESIEELDEKEISETEASEIELNNDVEETQDTDVKVETETASEPLATDASGNLTPEAIAALMAQNNEPEPEPVESESAEEEIEEEPVESEISNIESTDDVKVETETQEPESEAELETETATEPLATDASGNLTPEAIAALMAQNNELETEPIESESAEEAVEEEPVESEIPNIESTDDIEVETETGTEPLATDASGNLTPEAIAALMAKNNEPEPEPIESESIEELDEKEISETEASEIELNNDVEETQDTDVKVETEMQEPESEAEVETETATEPLATDASGNLTPEAIAALMAQNNEPEPEPIESESAEEAVEEETVEPESEAEVETKTASEPLATDASGNLTPEAIAALMAQNNEPEPEPVESESAEEAIEEEPAESEIPNIESTDDVEVETETQEPESEAELETEAATEPLATDASGNLTPEAIAALMAQNNELETEPIESETSEEAVEEEPVESEISNIESTDDVELETETGTEPLATDASGNLTPEAIAALMAQNNELETEPIESETSEEAVEEEPVELEIPNIESTDDVEVETETQEPESEAEVETETASEPLATDASGNLTPEAIAALMAQNNEPEPEPVESESAEEEIEEEPVESEIPNIESTDDVKVETETATEPLATDASGNLTPEAIAALLAQNSDINLKPEIAEAIANLLVKNDAPNEDEPIETDESTAEDEAESPEIEESSTEYEVEAIDAAESAADDEKDELKELNPDDIIPSTMSPGESGDGVLSDLEAAAFESDIIDDIFTPEENDEPLSQEAPKDFEFSEYEIPEESEEAPSENEESNETPEPRKEGFDSLGKRVASNDGAKKEEKSKTGKSILTLLLGAFLIVPSLLMKLKPKSKKNAKKKGQNTTEAAVQTESSTENTEVAKENKPRGFMAKLSKKKKNANSDGEDGENNSSGKKKKPKPKKKPKKKKKKEKAENSEDQGGNKGGKKKKIIMIAVILIIVLGASAFAAMKFGFINIGKSSSKSVSGDKNGPVGEVLEEEKKDYKEPNILRTEGVDEKADWFKVNFSKRYGLQNEDGLFEVFKLSDKELKAARAAAAEEVLAAKSIISEKAKAPDEGEISKDEAKADSNKKKDKSEDKKSDKDKDSDKDKKSDKAKDSDKDKKSDKKDEESKDEKSTKEPSKKQLAAKAVIKAEDNARNWAYYSASINAYNTIGTEGFKFLNAEFLKKQNEEKVYSSNYNRNTTAMLFSGVNDFKIEKTLISSDYKKAYIEFTRNVNVQRLTDPSVLMDTFLDGIVIGSENPQKFGVELTYDEDLQDFRVNNIYRMEAEKQKKKK